MIAQWLSQHSQALSLVMERMWRNRLATLMMLGVMGVTLSLPALLYIVADNLGRFAGELRSEPQISLFLALDAEQESVDTLETKLKQHAAVQSYRFVPRDTAWQRLRQDSGLGEIADGLERNPLPDAYVVVAKDGSPQALEQLQQEAAQWPGVEHAQLDGAWIKRLHALIRLGDMAAMVLAGLLGFALVAIIGNTIRLQVLTQREEIEVSKLIGATDRFIRRPFLYVGSIYGLGGGLAAWLLLCGVVWLFNLSITDLAGIYGADFHLLMPGWQPFLLLVSGACALGWLGAYWSVSRSLTEIESA